MNGEGSSMETKQMAETAVIAQHDWFTCIRNPEAEISFFVGIREYGSLSDFIDIRYRGGNLLAASPERVHVEKLSARRLAVTFKDSVSTTFVAPRIEFTTMHSSSVQSVDVSPSGRLAVSSDSHGRIVVWNTDTAEIIRNFVGHIFDVNRCRFFPSGLVVLSAGMDMSVRIWSVETGQCPRVLKGHKQGVVDIGIIDRGKEVLSCSKDGSVKMWNCGSAECLRTWCPEVGVVNALSVKRSSAVSNIFGVACEMRAAKVYDIRSDEPGITIDTDGEEGTAITFGKNSESDNLFIGTSDGSILSYDLKAGKMLAKLKTSRGAVTRLCMEDSFGLIASFHDGTVGCYEVPLNSKTAKIEFSGADCDPIYDISAIAEGRQLYTACRDRIVRRYTLE
uniref:SAM-dependent MTase RsmB/NOP-type domain-containing protein n=1 Tax=Parascaris univalens TaxID=6257 RepID=A0A915AQ47_PARUN